MLQYNEKHRRLEELIDGRLGPVCETPPLLLSTQSTWAGFLLERDLCRDGSAGTILYPHTSLVLVTSGSIAVEDHALHANQRFVARPGSVTLWPAGHESKSISWSPEPSGGAPTEMIRVQLNLSVLKRLAPEAVPNAANGNARMLWPPALGIYGNSHMIMQDKNNLQIGDMILKWIDRNVRSEKKDD